ncbi:hypothetical protein GWK47_025622 [Chionoecetes opilio]|uniref:Uncharacterized protein n=1 Tax=Chionoecetes opilio TaxID=41210 RepID=A0A8J8WN37_CHIOP|nr:hypothetical protein GWK47_025622 [Chionoecetes opilio]
MELCQVYARYQTRLRLSAFLGVLVLSWVAAIVLLVPLAHYGQNPTWPPSAVFLAIYATQLFIILAAAQLLQLAELRLNPRARPSHSTRAAHNIDHQVTVPFARTDLRSFLPRYGRLWNTLVRQTDLHLTTSMHAFKSGVNGWLQAELTQ